MNLGSRFEKKPVIKLISIKQNNTELNLDDNFNMINQGNDAAKNNSVLPRYENFSNLRKRDLIMKKK